MSGHYSWCFHGCMWGLIYGPVWKILGPPTTILKVSFGLLSQLSFYGSFCHFCVERCSNDFLSTLSWWCIALHGDNLWEIQWLRDCRYCGSVVLWLLPRQNYPFIFRRQGPNKYSDFETRNLVWCYQAVIHPIGFASSWWVSDSLSTSVTHCMVLTQFLQLFTTQNWSFQIWIKTEQKLGLYLSKPVMPPISMDSRIAHCMVTICSAIWLLLGIGNREYWLLSCIGKLLLCRLPHCCWPTGLVVRSPGTKLTTCTTTTVIVSIYQIWLGPVLKSEAGGEKFLKVQDSVSWHWQVTSCQATPKECFHNVLRILAFVSFSACLPSDFGRADFKTWGVHKFHTIF